MLVCVIAIGCWVVQRSWVDQRTSIPVMKYTCSNNSRVGRLSHRSESVRIWMLSGIMVYARAGRSRAEVSMAPDNRNSLAYGCT